MAAVWVFYSLVTAALFAGAGWASERLLAALGRPRRWAWAVAVAGTVLGAPLLVAGFQAAGSFLGHPGVGAPGPSGMAPSSGLAGGVPWMELPPVGSDEGFVGWLASMNGWIFAAWTACTVLYGLRLLGQWHRLRAESMAWRRKEGAEIRVTDGRGPVAMGWREATILVPQWFFELDETDRATVLEHELEHVRAGDHQLLLAAALLLGLAPWNPALRWSVRRLRDAVELDCDRRLVDAELDPAGYARLLLESRRRMAEALLPFAASASETGIQRRIRTMLRPDDLPLGRVFAVGGGVTIGCLVAALLTASHLQSSGLLGFRFGGGDVGSSPSALASGTRCQEVAYAGHRTDVSVRLLRTDDSKEAVILVRENSALQKGEEGVAGVVRAASGSPCEVTGQALRFEIGPPALDDVVQLSVSPDARVGVLDERTGRTAAIHTPSAGEPAVRCAFGPEARLACGEPGG